MMLRETATWPARKLAPAVVLIVLIHIAFKTQPARCFNFSAFSISDLFIAYGTVWCGMGNKATDCDHLGHYAETDMCCRAHDMCPYTYTTSNPNYNGYKLLKFHTMSHCECDMLFNECLHEQPYKTNSYEIWSSYDALHVKCFAYLPCHASASASTSPLTPTSTSTPMPMPLTTENISEIVDTNDADHLRSSDTDSDSFSNIWLNAAHRNTGSCFQGFRVIEFDSIVDYYTFLVEKLSDEQIEQVRRLLADNVDLYLSVKRQSTKCYAHFEHLPSSLIEHFTQRFQNKSMVHRTDFNDSNNNNASNKDAETTAESVFVVNEVGETVAGDQSVANNSSQLDNFRDAEFETNRSEQFEFDWQSAVFIAVGALFAALCVLLFTFVLQKLAYRTETGSGALDPNEKQADKVEPEHV